MSDQNPGIEFAEKKKKAFDQMASMHFILSDRYKTIAAIEYAFEITVSVALCGAAFFDFSKVSARFSPNASIVTGWLSIALFAFTLIKQYLSRSDQSEKHRVAGKMLTQAKLDLTSKIEKWKVENTAEKEILAYIDNHFSVLNDLPQIPEKDFLRLKHKHLAKIDFSKYLDSHHKESWLLCRLKYMFSKK